MINIVLYQPEISQNTANIIRTCAAIGAKLHIIKPTAFDLHPHWLKRSAAGKFLSDIEHEIHSSYQDFMKFNKNSCIYYLTRYSKKVYSEINFVKDLDEHKEIFLVFGRESTGINLSILRENIDKCLRIPMLKTARSLNLSNSVSVVGYEIMRQINFKNLSTVEVQKGEDFLWKKN